jgi:phosphomevalonate kinase
VRIAARAPGKVVVLGEYAVLDGAPALVLAIDRYAVATLEPSRDGVCSLRTLSPEPVERRFAPGAPSGTPLVDLVTASARAAPAWRGSLDSTQLYSGETKLGLGSSAAALCAFAGAWTAYASAGGGAVPAPTLAGLVALHRAFQGGRGSGIDVAASFAGGVVEFRLDPSGMPRIGSVRLPNSVGFAGIFTGRSASTPEFVAHYRDWKAARPAAAAAMLRRLSAAAEAGCAAARGEAADAFVEAIADYGRGLRDLGVAIGADIVTAEHRQIGEHARRHGVAYKVSGAGGGDLGLACARDRAALAAFEAAVREQGFRVLGLGVAEHGVTVNELADERVGEQWE